MIKKLGKLVSFEGAECTGKSTQIRLIKKYCDERNIQSLITREPGGSPYAEKIRNLILKDPDAKDADAMTLFYLFWAARSDHIHRTILPALKAGYIVFTDRFDGTTFSHQIYGQEAFHLRDLFFRIRNEILGSATPVLYMFFDMEVEKILPRLAKRKGEVNHFDVRDIEFHERVRAGCLEFSQLFPSIVINADQSEEDVHHDVVKHLTASRIVS